MSISSTPWTLRTQVTRVDFGRTEAPVDEMDGQNRRELVGFDPDHFRKKQDPGQPLDRVEAFEEAFRSNLWRGTSRSGPGSSREQTAEIEVAIPEICRRLDVRRLLDVPCGDFSWMANVELDGASYLGADLVPEIVHRNRELHEREDRTFLELDLVRSELPAADLILCRDCLVHLSNADIEAALGNIGRSESRWLLTTTFPEEPENIEIVTGDWRPVDLTKAPFELPQPVALVNEGCTEQGGAFADKSLGLWPVSALAERSV